MVLGFLGAVHALGEGAGVRVDVLHARAEPVHRLTGDEADSVMLLQPVVGSLDQCAAKQRAVIVISSFYAIRI